MRLAKAQPCAYLPTHPDIVDDVEGWRREGPAPIALVTE
jgi:hypothetical protein